MPATRRNRLRKSNGQLATVLASAALARLVTHFVLRPDAALHFQALRRTTGLSSRSLQHELARLEQLGLVTREADGALVRYRAVPENPRWRALREFVGQFADPAEVLRVALAQVPEVEGAFLYGSYARKTAVHPGSDVDVFVVGDGIDHEDARLALAEQALDVAGLIGREVNITRYTRDRLAGRYARGGRFIRAVLDGDKDWLVGSEAVLAAALPDGTGADRSQA